MRGSRFRFAVGQALTLGAVTVLVAMVYDLPVRDPDGADVKTYVRLPLILLLAFLVDVVPRALARRPRLADAPRALLGVVRERWPAAHVRFALVGLGAWYLTYVAFRNLKSYVPFVNDRLYDETLARVDRLMWLGRDPAQVLHDLLGTTWAAHVLSFVYVAWIALLPASLAIALVWSRHARSSEWYVTAVAVDWVLGVATYFAVPSLGPVYADPGAFADLTPTWVTSLQTAMIEDRVAVLADPFATGAVQTIAAFASLHVAITVTACLCAELMDLPRWVRTALWVFLALTVVSTVYLGWHYFADAVGGAALGAAGVLVGAWVTGNHDRGVPQRISRSERQSSSASRIRAA
ncbi:MAG TPA: phosphatase PAP2 family protein [Nocardioides sp.]|uniref:phosphatase PAP2 family protein n=1 Tax=Nocardioides sp. TaxID=35761 RepID=UPI002D802706|nr:phosphatase PAP2 family protein [Nocardioides sp.]HET6651678.1 phosphatase PAP2 family protein [Nocardioides sp.]